MQGWLWGSEYNRHSKKKQSKNDGCREATEGDQAAGVSNLVDSDDDSLVEVIDEETYDCPRFHEIVAYLFANRGSWQLALYVLGPATSETTSLSTWRPFLGFIILSLKLISCVASDTMNIIAESNFYRCIQDSKGKQIMPLEFRGFLGGYYFLAGFKWSKNS